MNHCPHCQANIGDYETVEALTAPLNVSRLPGLVTNLPRIIEPFEAVAVVNKCQAETAPKIEDAMDNKCRPIVSASKNEGF